MSMAAHLLLWAEEESFFCVQKKILAYIYIKKIISYTLLVHKGVSKDVRGTDV